MGRLLLICLASAAVAGPALAQESMAGSITPQSQEPDMRPSTQTMQTVGGQENDAASRPSPLQLSDKARRNTCTTKTATTRTADGKTSQTAVRTCGKPPATAAASASPKPKP